MPRPEENGNQLTDSRHMFDLVPLSSRRSIVVWGQRLKGNTYVSAISDGTLCLVEVLAVVVHFISDCTIQQSLVHLEFLMKSMSVEEVAWEFISVLSITLSVESHRLLAIMQDKASANTGAMHIATIMYPNLLDMECISHMFNHVGERFKAPTLSLFWIAFFSHSPRDHGSG